MREYRARDPERTRAKEREYYARNLDEQRAKKAANMRRYRAERPDKHRSQSRAAKQKLRDLLFSMYGQVCALCSYADKRALTLDHVKRNGSAERKQLGERGVYRKASTNYDPDSYRILCMNCQFVTRST
jgi:hypothetical protein